MLIMTPLSGSTTKKLVLRSKDGEEPPRALDVGRGVDGSFSVVVQRRLLTPGAYQIDLLGVQDSQEERIETYPFIVAP